jgi:hypothetical protein
VEADVSDEGPQSRRGRAHRTRGRGGDEPAPGVAIVQAAETEAVLAEILCILDPSADRARPSGRLLTAVEKKLDTQTLDRWSWELDVIDAAIKRRNRIVHDTVQIGYTWRDFATGDGGHYVQVISLLGAEDRDEADLRNDLDLQRRATQYAIEVLHHLKHRDGKSEEARYCASCVQKLTEDHRTSGV